MASKSKKEIYEGVVKAVGKVIVNFKVSKEAEIALLKVLDEQLKPKVGGMFQKRDISEVTKSNAEGKISHILCSISNVFLPATDEFFYREKNGEGIAGFRRGSKPGEAVLKAHKRKAITIVNDITAGRISPAEGQKLLDAYRNSKPDFSVVNENYFKNKVNEVKAKKVSKTVESKPDSTEAASKK